jgi:hypothetical protein
MYTLVWNALKDKDAVVNVEGWKTVINGKVEHLNATNITPAPEYLEDDLERIFGCDPQFTGNRSTEDFIDDLRGETTEDYIGYLTDQDE